MSKGSLAKDHLTSQEKEQYSVSSPNESRNKLALLQYHVLKEMHCRPLDVELILYILE